MPVPAISFPITSGPSGGVKAPTMNHPLTKACRSAPPFHAMPRPRRGRSLDSAQYKPSFSPGMMACTRRNLEFGRATVAVVAERGFRPHPKFLPPIFRHRCGFVVAARRRRALLIPQDISTASLPTIPGAVEARGLGDCSRDPLFQGRFEIAITQTEVDGPSHSTWRPR